MSAEESTSDPPVQAQSDEDDIPMDEIMMDLEVDDLVSDSDEIPEYSEPETRGNFELTTLKDLLEKEHERDHFETDSVIEKLFVGKGIKSGDVIEVCGCSIAGKTMLVSSYALDILIKYEKAQIAFIDTKNDIQPSKIHNMLKARAYDDDVIKKDFFTRIYLFNAANMYELESTLQTMIDGQTDYKKIALIIIDSITVPFYAALGSYKPSMQMTSRIHELIFKLAKGHNKTIMITNLQINKFNQPDEKIREESDEESSESEHEEEYQYDTETTKPALTKYWGEILDARLLIAPPDDNKDDIFALLDSQREVKVIESNTAMPLRSILVNITDKGIE